jgi:hypothetical protein
MELVSQTGISCVLGRPISLPKHPELAGPSGKFGAFRPSKNPTASEAKVDSRFITGDADDDDDDRHDAGRFSNSELTA